MTRLLRVKGQRARALDILSGRYSGRVSDSTHAADTTEEGKLPAVSEEGKQNQRRDINCVKIIFQLHTLVDLTFLEWKDKK